MSRRSVAIAIACAIAGALETAHSLAYGGFDPRAVAYTIATTAIELVVLAAIYDRKRSLVAISAVALALGFASAFVTASPLRIVVEIGAYNGVLAVGLWALAVAMPEARARTAEL